MSCFLLIFNYNEDTMHVLLLLFVDIIFQHMMCIFILYYAYYIYIYINCLIYMYVYIYIYTCVFVWNMCVYICVYMVAFAL